MRLFNKIVSLLLICSVTMLCLGYPHSISALDERLEPNESNDVTKEFKQNQEEANKAYTAFFNYYYDEQKRLDKKATGYLVNGVTKESLPEYFGGMYINKYGDFVFEVLSKYETNNFYESDTYKEILDTTKAKAEHVVIRYVENSYCDMLTAMDKLLNLIETGMAGGKNAITSIGINDSKNGIDVYFSFIPEKDFVNRITEECGDIKVFVHEDCGTIELQ